MRGLLALVIFMGVLIVAGVATIAVTIVHRMGGAGGGNLGGVMADTVLDEPAGTRMMSVGADGNRLAVLLSGGGPDRVVLVGPLGAVVGRIVLRR